MRYLFVAWSMLLGPVAWAEAQVSVGVGLPAIDIGVHLDAYPELVLVPGYPVYYDPRASTNYFFYDGLYWVYQGDAWYASSWYDGPWRAVGPLNVPLFVLRVPVRYYRQPPAYFRGWRGDAAPRWGERWGRGWEARRAGWDRWDRRSAPRPAPLPVYQRSYAGGQYPRAPERQRAIRSENYRHQPREAVGQQRYQRPGDPGRGRAEPRPAPARERPQAARPAQQTRPSPPRHQAPPAAQPPPQQRPRPLDPRDQGRVKRGEEHGQDRR